MKKMLIIFLFTLTLIFNPVVALEKDMSYTVLPSGQKVVIKEIRDNNIVKIDTWINTGSINEDEKTTGISHFLEHLFFKGTQKYPSGTFDKILDSKGAEVNAATSKDYTHYYIQIPSKYFDTALELHADMLLNPMIPRKELERERPVVIEEISKCKDSPVNRAFNNLYKIIYEKSNHPYKRAVIGKKEVIENVTREEILNYYNRFYTPDAFTTVIVGDVDKDEALKKVASAFNQKKAKQEKVKYPKIKPLTSIEKIEDTMDVNKTYMMIGFLAPKFEDEKETYPLDILSTILTSGKSSVLNQKLKEDKELVMSVSSGNYSQKDSGVFYIYAILDPEKEKVVEKEIIQELQNIQRGNLDENAISKAKNMIKTNTYYARESISNISDDLGYDFTFSKNENYYDNYLKNIDKVTKKEIIEMAKKYLDIQRYAISIVRPASFKPVSNLNEKSNAKQNLTQTKLIEQKDNIRKNLLNNGATLITKNKKTNSIIAIDISIKGSKAVEKKPTVAMMSANTITGGTQNYTNSQFAQFLDENGIKLAINSSNDVFSITLQTTKNNLDKAYIALDEVINKAVFPDSEIEKVRSRKIKELKAISDTPSSYVFDEFRKLAFQNTIYGQNSTFILNNITKVTRADIVDFYSKIINPENMTISVVGDVDENELINQFEKIICKNPKGEKFSYEKINFTKYQPVKNIESVLYKNEVQANWIALGWKTGGIKSLKDRKDYAVLAVIDAILGDGMSSRLFVHLREEQGLAYTVGSNIMTNILDGAFVAYIGTNAQSVEKAKQGILNEINILKREMVTSEELNDAKNKIMGKFLMSLETNMAEADLFGWYDVLGRNLEAFEEYKKMIMNVNQADIIEVANRYFSKPYIYVVVKENKK